MTGWLRLAQRLVITLAVLGSVSLEAQEKSLVPQPRSFVPLEDLDAVLERDREGVLLPKVEFEKLLRAAEEQARKHPVPAQATVLSHSDYRLEIQGDQLLIKATATLEQLRPDWQVWSLHLPRLAVERAAINGQAASIARGDDGVLQVFTSTVGRHQLELELSTELVSLGSDQAAGFALLPSAAGTLTISVPVGKRLVLDGTDMPRPTPLAEPADYRVAVGGRKQVQLRITDRVDQQRTDGLVFASTGYGLVVAPGEVTWHALTTLQVFGHPVDRVVLSVPATLEIADVESTGLEAWELGTAEGEERTVLTLTYGQPIDGSRRIAVRGVMAVAAGEPWSVPPLSIANVNSHVGQIVIQHPAAVRLQTLETEGVRRATTDAKPVSDMPEATGPVAAASTLRFDAWRQDFMLRLATEPKQRELHVAVAGVLDLASRQAELQAAFTVTTRFAPLFEFDVDVPAEWSVLSATAQDNQTLKWQVLPHEPGINRIRVHLPAPLAAGRSTVLNLHWRYAGEGWPVEQQPVELALPELVVPQAALVETALVIRGDHDLELTTSEVTGLDLVPLKADWERLRLQSQDTRYSARLKISRKSARVAVETLAYYRLDPQTLHAWMQAVVDVEGGGLRALEVSLPGSAGETVRFSAAGAPLVEQQSLEPAGGRRRWRLTFGERVFGRFAIWTEIERPREPGVAVEMPLLEITDATRAHGALVLEAGPEQQLTVIAANAQNQPLLEIDPVDLPRSMYQLKERIVAAYRTIGSGNTLTVTEQRFSKSAVPTAVCTALNVTTVASRTGEMQHQADYGLRLSGVQQLQVGLPESAELWGALLNDRPVEIRRTDGQLLISLPLDAAGEYAATLKLFYGQTLDALTGAGTLTQAPPTLGALMGSGTFQTVDILQQSWRLVHPSDTLVVDSHSALEPRTALDVPGWLMTVPAQWEPPRGSHVTWAIFVLVVTAGTWAFLLLIYRRFGGKGVALLAVLAVPVGLLGLVIALSSPADRRNANAYGMKGAPETAAIEFLADDMAAATPSPLAKPMPAGVQSGGDGVVATIDSQGMPRAGQTSSEPMSESAEKSSEPTEAQVQDGQRQMTRNQPAMPQAAEPQDRPAVAGVGVAPQERVSQSGLLGAKDSGLLSLALKLETPPGSRHKDFHYVGSAAVGQGVPLEIGYVDRRGGIALRSALLAVGLLLAWSLRRWSIRRKLAVVVTGLAISLGLMPIAPVAWQPLLDGLFAAIVGALVAWSIWTLGRGIERLGRWCCPRWATTLLLTAAWCGSVETISAQEKPALPPIPPSLVEVYENDPLAADQVLIPQAKFIELYRLAHPEQPVRTPAPTPGGLISALYSGELVPADDGAEAAARFRARYILQSHVDGQLSVPLPLRGVAIHSAVLDDQAAPLVTTGDPWTVLLTKPGLHVLDLEFSVPAKISGSAGSFAVTLQASPAAKLSLRLPDEKLNVRVNGSTSAYRRATRDGQTFVELPVDRGGEVRVSWQPDQARGGAAVIHAESVTAVTASDAGASVSAGFRLRVRQGVIRDLSFALPLAVKLRTITGPDVGGWELVGDETDRKLRVFFRRNVGDQTELTIDGFLSAQLEQDTAVSVPGITPLEITAEVGHVVVYAGPQFAVRTASADNLMQVDATQFTPTVPVTRLELSPQVAYRFNRRPWTLDLRISRLATQLRATVRQGVRISHRKTQVTAKIVCDLSLVPRSSLELEVPADWLILDVQSPGLRDWYRTPSDDRAVLTIDYDQPQQGQLPIVLLASESRTEATASVTLSAPGVTGAHRQQRQIAVWFDRGLTGRSGTLNGWRATDPGSIDAELTTLRQVPAQLAFESNSESPGIIDLTVEQMQPLLSADSLAVITVTDVGVVYGLILQWQIERASADTLVFETPSWLAGRLQFDRLHVRDVTEAVSEEESFTRWTVKLRGPVSGRFLLAASAVSPQANDRVEAPGLRFLSTDGTPLDTQRHYVLLSNTSLSQLTSVDPALTEPVQPEDLDLVVRPELVQQATEFVRVKMAGRAPSWSLQRYTPTANIPAAVNLADFVTVVARDGSYRTSATLTLKNRTRQFLGIRLPADSRLLSVLVSGQPARAVETSLDRGDVQLIALPKTSAVDLSFPVQIVYSGRLPRHLPTRDDFQPQTLELPSLDVIGQDESAEFGIPVARTQWTVHLPDDLHARPLTDPLRHNLNRAREADTRENVVQVLISDAEDLVSALSDVSGIKGRMRAYSNLKQLGQALDNYSDYTSSNAEYREKADAVRENLAKLRQSIEVEHSPGPIVVNGAVQSQDAKQQWSRALGNNSVLFGDNRNGNLDLGMQIDTTFNFAVPETATKTERARDGGALARQAVELGGNSISVEARQQYQAFNEEQLSRLNTAIAGKKLAEQSPQQQQRLAGQDYFSSRFAQPRGGAAGMPGSGPVTGTTADGTMMRSDLFGAQAADQRGFGLHTWFDSDAEGVRGEDLVMDLDSLQQLSVGAAVGGRVSAVMRGGIGGGGFGGGVGGMPVEGEELPRGWTQAGGLSLQISVPTAGQKLVFSKAGGDAKLALQMWPQASVSWGLGGLWFLAWAVAAFLVLMALRTESGRRRLLTGLPLVLCALAAAGVIFAPGLWRLVAWIAFAMFAGWIAWTHRHAASATAG